MRYVILYADSCRACSEVARLATDTAITGLEARALEDPWVTESLSKAGLDTPDRPALLVMGDTGNQVLTGWPMRRRLAAVVGWRRSRTIVRLLVAERRAQAVRSAASHVPSRRGVIGAALAGLTGWAVTSGAAKAEVAAPAGAHTIADPATATTVLATPAARRAIRAWGPAEQQVLEISGSHPVFVLAHPEREVYTFVDNASGALRDGDPVAVSMGLAPTAERALRYYTVDGVALADVAVSDGQVTATPVAPDATQADSIKPWQIACFAACIGRRSGAQCIITCENCFYYAVGTLARLIACSNCLVCAGPNGVPCLKECAII
jgi:hypothetical protein